MRERRRGINSEGYAYYCRRLGILLQQPDGGMALGFRRVDMLLAGELVQATGHGA